MTRAASSAAPGPGEEIPGYLAVIDLAGRIVISYFAVVTIALLVDIARGDRLVFRSWTSFGLQAIAAFLLAAAVARRTHGWKAFVIGAALGLGTLAGGFFPDAASYRPRAPEMFFRSMAALIPAVTAVYGMARWAAAGRTAPTPVGLPPSPPLTGEAREAAVRALDLLDRGDRALAVFHERAVSAGGVTKDDADELWAALDGNGYIGWLRQMPPDHAVTNALREAAVAQTDVAYLTAFARGAHGAMGHTTDTARRFITEVAGRRGQPGADPDTLAGVARSILKQQRHAAAALLHATRFASPGTQAGLPRA